MSDNLLQSWLRKNTPVLNEELARWIYLRERKHIDSITSKEEIIKIITDIYKKESGKTPNLEEPTTFHEKQNWLKLHWFDERAIVCSDKYLVREYVNEKGLGFLLNDLYGVYDNADQIDVDLLPDRFVLKTTHDSGMHVIVCDNNKDSINWKLVKRKLDRWLSVDFSYASGEWPYHTDHPKIICEKFLEDHEKNDLVDYKFMCFNGKPELIFYASDRKNHVKADFYDLEWNLLPFRWKYEPSGIAADKPKCLEKMIEYSKILSEGFPFVRVDFYEIEGKVIFGELTFFHGGGCGWFEPEQIDYQLGDMLVLPDKRSDPWGDILAKKVK